MKRRIPGLSQAALPISEVADGVYLVQVERVQYRWDKQKPYYKVQFAVLEPKQCIGICLPGRLYCTEKALWKLSWFLRDFGYDTDLLGRDELDEKRMAGLKGVLKVSHTTVNFPRAGQILVFASTLRVIVSSRRKFSSGMVGNVSAAAAAINSRSITSSGEASRERIAKKI